MDLQAISIAYAIISSIPVRDVCAHRWFRRLPPNAPRLTCAIGAPSRGCPACAQLSPVGLVLSHKLHRMGEFAPQYIFSALVIRISVSTPAGEIVIRIVFVGVEVSGFSSAKSW
jgi:hypothetical protein